MFKSVSTQLKKDTVLTQAAFDRLLSCLGPDQESASSAYISLWQAVVAYFAIRGAEVPDLLADEAFDRVARRLSEGQSIFTRQPANYFFGVARNVWRESLSRSGFTTRITDESALQSNLSPSPQQLMLKSMEAAFAERRLACLERCLSRFSTVGPRPGCRVLPRRRRREDRETRGHGFKTRHIARLAAPSDCAIENQTWRVYRAVCEVWAAPLN